MTDPTAKVMVLIADDDDDIRALVAFRLERAGYEVLSAVDGAQALELATLHLPDVALLDLSMPKLNGYEVTRRLRAGEATSAMPVILLTARAQETDRARGFEAGADDYVKKPFSPLELAARVEAVLARRAGVVTDETAHGVTPGREDHRLTA